MVRTIPIYIGNTIWDDALRTYRPLTWGDRQPVEQLFEEKIVPQCTKSGYQRVVRNCPKWTGEMQDDPLLDPFVDLLTRIWPEIPAVMICVMAFGPIGKPSGWGRR
jgi:hypothetical protein